MYYAKEVVEELRDCKQIVVFGAGVMAQNVVYCLQKKPYEFQIEYCVVSDLINNPSELLGVKVIDLEAADKLIEKEAAILIAALDRNVDAIKEILQNRGYFNLYSCGFDGDLWSAIRGNSYQEFCKKQGKVYLLLEEELQNTEVEKEACQRNVSIYVAKCHVDKPLKEDTTRYEWEIPIQVGTALTEERICEICDNTGDNISMKNKQYCELTALYWIWKNDRSDYAGLCHYRRHFELSREMLEKLGQSDIDVVLTIPIFNYLGVGEVYRRDHVGADWEVMLAAIECLSPDYLDIALKLQEGQYYYGYNMFIARKEILNAYCEWLFPILTYCEEHCAEKNDSYQNRYIGFLAERLLSIYFMHHENDYKIVHADKHFID